MGLANYEINALLWAHWAPYWNWKPTLANQFAHSAHKHKYICKRRITNSLDDEENGFEF